MMTLCYSSLRVGSADGSLAPDVFESLFLCAVLVWRGLVAWLVQVTLRFRLQTGVLILGGMVHRLHEHEIVESLARTRLHLFQSSLLVSFESLVQKLSNVS